MKRLSEYKNEEAIDLLVEILDPCAEMMSDEEAMDLLNDKDTRMDGVKLIIKNHKRAVISLLAALDGIPVDQYECSFFAIPLRLIEILNDKELLSFFMDARTMSSETSFGSAMENTEEHGE